jgi:hypothetical protein
MQGVVPIQNGAAPSMPGVCEGVTGAVKAPGMNQVLKG